MLMATYEMSSNNYLAFQQIQSVFSAEEYLVVLSDFMMFLNNNTFFWYVNYVKLFLVKSELNVK
jgi:hypothetical protein